MVFLAMAGWEVAAPRRASARGDRWPTNLGLAVLNTAVLRLLFPAAAVGVAAATSAGGVGLLHRWPLPGWAAVVVAVVLLDLAIYLQHVLFHAVPALWRLHRVHHVDLGFDVTTGIRFHPVEILLSMGFKIGLVVAIGAPALAVVLFEVLLNATSMFNHGNVRLPASLDRALRWIVVTPDMHRVHHSVRPSETNRNFGFNLPWWDRLLGTYRDQPAAGHEGMEIGLESYRDAARQRFAWALGFPFRGAGEASLFPGPEEERS